MNNTTRNWVRWADLLECIVAEEEYLETEGDTNVHDRQEYNDEPDRFRIRLKSHRRVNTPRSQEFNKKYYARTEARIGYTFAMRKYPDRSAPNPTVTQRTMGMGITQSNCTGLSQTRPPHERTNTHRDGYPHKLPVPPYRDRINDTPLADTEVAQAEPEEDGEEETVCVHEGRAGEDKRKVVHNVCRGGGVREPGRDRGRER